MTLTEMPEAAGTPAAPRGPSTSTARMPDGTLLRTLRWEPAGEPWAGALIVHGLGEHAGRYDTVAVPLAAAGIDVHAFDLRGFGGSAGPRASVDRWSRLHDDIEELLAKVRAIGRPRPVILYGHSLGGLLAAGYVLAEPPRPLPDLLVLSAPGLQDGLPRWKHAAAGILGVVLPRMRIPNGLPGESLCRDAGIQGDYAADPLNVASTTTGFGRLALREQARVRAVIDAIDAMPVPTYVLHGSADPVVPPHATEALGSRGNVTRRVHDGLRHECHHEPERAEIMAEIVVWLEMQRAAGVEGAAAGGV